MKQNENDTLSKREIFIQEKLHEHLTQMIEEQVSKTFEKWLENTKDKETELIKENDHLKNIISQQNHDIANLRKEISAIN